MSETSPRLDLPYIQPSQAQKHVTHNESLQRLDALVQMTVLALATPRRHRRREISMPSAPPRQGPGRGMPESWPFGKGFRGFSCHRKRAGVAMIWRQGPSTVLTVQPGSR